MKECTHQRTQEMYGDNLSKIMKDLIETLTATHKIHKHQDKSRNCGGFVEAEASEAEVILYTSSTNPPRNPLTTINEEKGEGKG